MSDLTLIILAAGSSSRFGQNVKKQWLRIGHEPLWLFVTKRLKNITKCENIIIVTNKDDLPFMEPYLDEIVLDDKKSKIQVVAGGDSRQASLLNATKNVTTSKVIVNDVARACVDIMIVKRLIENQNSADVIVPYLKVSDTMVLNNTTINRDEVKRIQTPQLSTTSVLLNALEQAQQENIEYTDESSAIVAYAGTRAFVIGDDMAHKITFTQDLKQLPCLEYPSIVNLVGNGFDVHTFEDNRIMMLGGIAIDSVTYGFKAHSDGDVAIHALIDALLGAAGMGDIGTLFPDNDSSYKNIDSKILLQRTVTKLHHFGFQIQNADITIMAETPKLMNYKTKMRKVLAEILKLPSARMNVKATTTEKLGFIGRKEGVGVMATATLSYYNWQAL